MHLQLVVVEHYIPNMRYMICISVLLFGYFNFYTIWEKFMRENPKADVHVIKFEDLKQVSYHSY